MELESEILDALRLARKSRQRTILSALAVLACIIMFGNLVAQSRADDVHPAASTHTIDQTTQIPGDARPSVARPSVARHEADNAEY
ncbi:MAG: hypothetical protein P1V21_04570 [Rhizobiaceae bacterium]|nr:hypothetical protein [Rhizobiaceae bacterium]